MLGTHMAEMEDFGIDDENSDDCAVTRLQRVEEIAKMLHNILDPK